MKQPTLEHTHPSIVIPPDYKCGPAMRKLNDRQRAFVVAMLDFGGLDNTKAAEAAGYEGEDRNSLRRTAYRLAHDPDIQEAIREEGQARLNSSGIMAVNTLLEIANAVDTEKKDKLKAIEMIMNRIGMSAKTEHNVNVTRKDLTSDEMIKRIGMLAGKLGVDAHKLLGGPAVDAEFTEVPATNESDDDIGDLL